MHVTVKALTGRKELFTFEPEDKVVRVKKALQEKEGIPINQIRLIHAGKNMPDDTTLAECNVAAGGTKNMVLALRGGM